MKDLKDETSTYFFYKGLGEPEAYSGSLPLSPFLRFYWCYLGYQQRVEPSDYCDSYNFVFLLIYRQKNVLTFDLICSYVSQGPRIKEVAQQTGWFSNLIKNQFNNVWGILYDSTSLDVQNEQI